MERPTLYTSDQRRRAVAWALALTADTPMAPQRYERSLLDLYQQGVLTIDEAIELLERSVYQVLYHSRATQRPTEEELQALLTESRAYNAAHQITGLLLYSEGRYVQVLEGAEADVRALYHRIQHDARHEQVVTVQQGPGPQRRFADWHMDFGQVAGLALEQVLAALQTPTPVVRLRVADPHLQALVEAFGR